MDTVKKKNGEITLEDLLVELKALRSDMNGRLDGILKLLGGHHRDHERRISALEKSMASLKKTG